MDELKNCREREREREREKVEEEEEEDDNVQKRIWEIYRELHNYYIQTFDLFTKLIKFYL